MVWIVRICETVEYSSVGAQLLVLGVVNRPTAVPLEHAKIWCAGVLVCWCAGVLACWCAGVLACWHAVDSVDLRDCRIVQGAPECLPNVSGHSDPP